MSTPTLRTLQLQLIHLQQEVHTLKQVFLQEPELRPEFIARLERLSKGKSFHVKDFRERYGLV